VLADSNYYRYNQTGMKYDPKSFSDVFASPLGAKLWRFLNSHESKLMMKTATKFRKPAVAAVSDELLADFGEEIRQDRIKQMIGHMVRQVMESEGYMIHSQNVPVRYGNLFNKGTSYELRA
jgi:hypothetical protein